ncbi:hypothetical protein NL676_006587 [Syzygium grande]|nr:hypothetical protein NL676_006587 [Syzygium grande]
MEVIDVNEMCDLALHAISLTLLSIPFTGDVSLSAVDLPELLPLPFRSITINSIVHHLRSVTAAVKSPSLATTASAVTERSIDAHHQQSNFSREFTTTTTTTTHSLKLDSRSLSVSSFFSRNSRLHNTSPFMLTTCSTFCLGDDDDELIDQFEIASE